MEFKNSQNHQHHKSLIQHTSSFHIIFSTCFPVKRWPSTWPATSTSPSARRGAVAAPRPWWRWALGPPRWCCGSRWPGPWRRPPAARRQHRGTTATAWCTAWGCATAPAGPGNGRSRCPGVWHRRWRIRVRSGAGAIRNARENDVKWVFLRMLSDVSDVIRKVHWKEAAFQTASFFRASMLDFCMVQ